jgi:hypothetical protein
MILGHILLLTSRGYLCYHISMLNWFKTFEFLFLRPCKQVTLELRTSNTVEHADCH